MTNSTSADTRIVVGPVRLSYVSVFSPRHIEGETNDKYACALLIPKSDKALVDRIKQAIVKAVPADAPKRADGKLAPTFRICLRDGDLERVGSDEYKGMYFINTSSSRKPGVVKKVMVKGVYKIIDCTEDEVYSGCWAYAAINFFAYNKSSNKGVGCGLNSIMKYRDDQPFGTSQSAEADYGGLDVHTEEPAAESMMLIDDLPADDADTGII